VELRRVGEITLEIMALFCVWFIICVLNAAFIHILYNKGQSADVYLLYGWNEALDQLRYIKEWATSLFSS
jgi:hypothetical protein